MIILEIEGYCEECEAFIPDVKRPEKYEDFYGNEIHMTDTIIRCSDRKKCEAIKRFLERKLQLYIERNSRSEALCEGDDTDVEEDD